MMLSYAVHHTTNLGRNIQCVMLIESRGDEHEAAIPTVVLDADTGEYIPEEEVSNAEMGEIVAKACRIKQGRELVGHAAIVEEDNWTDDGSLEGEPILITRSIQGEMEMMILRDPVPVKGNPTRHIAVSDMAAQSRGFDCAVDEILSTTKHIGHVSDMIRDDGGSLQGALDDALGM